MNSEDLKVLIDFNYWAKNQMMEAVSELSENQFLRDLSSSFASIRDTLVHSMSAERSWLSTWQETPIHRLKPEDFPSAGSVVTCWDGIEREMREFAESLKEVQQMVTVAKSDRSRSVYPLRQLIQHVVNHSSYHRGQVATLMRQVGAIPAKTDLVTYFGRS